MGDVSMAEGESRARLLRPDGLREAEERFRTVFVQASLAQALVDMDGRFVAANDAYCGMVGYGSADLMTRQLGDLTHPEDWPRNQALLRALMQQRIDSFVLEKRYVRGDGQVVHVRNHVRLVRDDQGQPRWVHAISLDQTARRAAEAALAASEARLRAMLEHSEDLVLLLETNGRVRHSGPRCEQVAPAFARLGASVFDTLEPGDSARLRAALGEVVLRGGDRRIQLRDTAPDGSARIWELRLENALDNPDLQAIIATFRNVTSQVRAEELAEGEAGVLRMLLTGTPRREALDALARVVEAGWPEVRATVLLVSEDGRSLRHGAGPSMPRHFIEAVDGLPIADGAGVCGTAAHRRSAVIVEDVATDPLVRDYRALLSGVDARSCWSLPLLDGQGNVLGTFALYGPRAASPTQEQWRLAQRLAELASLVIAARTDDGRLHGRGTPPQPEDGALAALTPKERAVLRLIALGHTNGEIAEHLRVSVRTVESHRAHASAKLGAVTRADLVRAAIAGGLLRLEGD